MPPAWLWRLSHLARAVNLRPATRKEVNEVLVPGSTWCQRICIGGVPQSAATGNSVRIVGHEPHAIHVEYDHSAGGPLIGGASYGLDDQGNVYLFKPDGSPFLIYSPVT